MDVEDLLGEVIRGALGARGKRHRGALHALTRGGRHGSLVTPAALIGALGVAWGLYEAVTASQSVPAATAPAPPPPPIPVAPDLPLPAAVPPAPSLREVPGVPPEVARVIRLTVSAARADGTLSASEESVILDHARRAGAEAVVQDELRQPTTLRALVEGAADTSRRDLYTLAYGIVRADETVSGAERIYLAQLAHVLDLDQPTITALESRAAGTIDQAGADAQTLGVKG